MQLNTNSQLVCVNSAMILIFFMIISFVAIAGWMPPLSPELNADQVAEVFRNNTNRIRLAGLVMTIGAVFLWPFGVAISEQMKRIEGQLHHPLANLQLATVTLTVGAIFLAGMLWMLCAFRPERAPEITQIMSDLSWFFFIGAIPPAVIQVLAIGYCVLIEHRKTPVMPRWFGFCNLWIATGFLVGEGVFFFKTGPFAWDGLAAFWMAAFFFFGWIIVTWYVVRQAILHEAAEAKSLSAQGVA